MSDEMASMSARRGSVLLEQGRYVDAEKFFREALASDPNDAQVLYQLSVCELNQERTADALRTIDRALALEPEVSPIHAFRAIVLTQLRKPTEALTAAEEALRLDPDSDYALVAKAGVYLSRKEWAKAEAAARQALAMNPDNPTAANQLAHSLRLQNRLEESATQSDYMLAEDPESPDNHTTAGWVALQRGQREKAESHFLEALRLRADDEGARQGLKEAFRARSPLYRAYLNYCFFMARFTDGKQWLIIIGLVVAMNVVPKLLPGTPGLLLSALYFLFVLWVHVAESVGDLQLLFDRFARHALTLAEKMRAVVVGGGVILGLLSLLIGFLAGIPLLLVLGLTGIAASFPFAYTFTNVASGRFLFGAIGLFVCATGVLNVAALLGVDGVISVSRSMVPIAFLAVVGTTWICSIPSLNRRR